eukprot:CAMPEP_0118960866 /NCGR_PEP_ID=MMETSP1169-20130426/63853_1 /TAXON_ID=36882 /ORGANISM="Pyramimonas obovata, Strain CCMP722" /LENGTH=332 /DNA_ID=CAMNT_0006909019 /DNA_START=254 /DNA_END=1249 /DNA_ORIENTATION=+
MAPERSTGRIHQMSPDNKVSSGVGMVMSEYCGHGAGRRTAIWMHKGPSIDSSTGASVELKMVRERGQKRARIKRTWQALFMPEGYPDSVSADYFTFQVWDSVQALCSYCRGVVTTKALLKGLGVGEDDATPLGAAFQWIMKDLVGMLGGMGFTLLQGTNFDSNAKQWRLFADCVNNIGLWIELAAPHFPSAFLFLIMTASVARSLTGVAAGATRAAMTQHFARAGNAADIAAKEGSQETCTTLLGMLLGMAIARFTDVYPIMVWPLFLMLTILHIYSNVKAVRCLRLNSINRERTRLLLHAYVASKRAPFPAEITPRESLLPGQQVAVKWAE